MQTYPKEQLLFAGLLSILNAYTLIWWSGPCRSGIEVSPPQIKFFHSNPPQGATFFVGPRRIINVNTLIWWNGPCRPGVGVSPLQIKFYHSNPA